MNITRIFSVLRQGGRYLHFLKTSKSLNYPELVKTAGICSTRHYTSSNTDQKEDGVIVKLLKKIPFLQIDSLRAKAAGYMLYENTVDNLNYLKFFEKFALPDTFYSWFVITELHVWMLSARVMADGSSGQILRNGVIEALWADTTQRMKKIGAVNPSETRKSTQELSEQFQAALVAYDEAINSDDIVLAGALWRRIYQKEYASPQHLESLINYVRKHISTLDQLNKEQIASVKAVVWDPL
ncbi:ubiquinol-cytochrome c reductase complex assembly factor 1 [Rhynchophorus ferrugineus]|uniref:ubiquinol-cytochrome c reductase complex assembly factor 1 n=1 Tax=Rhynchophorus ferrugineus TaxID=354439 RepID=UPI003FCC2A34